MLKTAPRFKDAAAAVVAGKSQPMSKDCGQVSDIIRTITITITITSAVLARTETPTEGVDEIDSRLCRVMR